jgi:predicted methyltransferase
LKDTKDRLIPTVIASYMSEAAQDEIAATARANEDRVLAVYADTPAASLADIARRLGWLMKTDEPDKMKVKRIVGKLAKAKLVTIERGKAAITDKGIELLPVATAKAGNG